MSQIVRFGMSLEKKLLARFDRLAKDKNYLNRSEAIRDLIREALVKEEWLGNQKVAGAISLVFNHTRRDLGSRLTDIQHQYQHLIVSTQHIHLEHDNCLEIIVIKGKANVAQRLCNLLKSTKGVKHAALTMATTGERIL